MKEIFLSNYISKISIKDVDDFAKSNGVFLNKQELDIVHKTIKKDWRTIMYGNPRPILDQIKSVVDPNNYQKIENLYVFFKNKYQGYL